MTLQDYIDNHRLTDDDFIGVLVKEKPIIKFYGRVYTCKSKYGFLLNQEVVDYQRPYAIVRRNNG